MLQRIQTIYLLLVVALTIAMMFMPLALIEQSGEFYKFEATGLVTAIGSELIYSTWGIFALLAVISLIAMITIFLYKNRILQIRLSVFNAILLLAFYGLFWFFYWNYGKEVKEAFGTDIDITLKFALAFPLISLILDYLAIRNIGADEALVRSLERLR